MATENPGRSLHRVPDSPLISFTRPTSEDEAAIATLVDLGNGSWRYGAAHQYSTTPPSGSFTITSTVTDDDLGVGSASTSVGARNTAPTLNPLLLSFSGIDEDENVTLIDEPSSMGAAETPLLRLLPAD